MPILDQLKEDVKTLDDKLNLAINAAISDDEKDHLQYVHMLLTSIKGHLGAAVYGRKNYPNKSGDQK